MKNTINYLDEFSQFKYGWGDLDRIIFLMIQCGITSEHDITLSLAKNFKKQYTAKEIYFAFERVTKTLLRGEDDK